MTTSDWVHRLRNPKSVTTVFEEVPSLENVEVTKMRLRSDGGVRVWVDLRDYPENPPERWSGNDGVVAEFALWGVTERFIETSGWLLGLDGRLEIQVADENLEVALETETGDAECRFICEDIYLERYSPYVAD